MIGFENHDHKACISEALDTVEKRCKASGLKFTPVRRRVLEILLKEHRALGAYDILDQLRAEGVVTGTGKPLPRVVGPIDGRGHAFADAISEDREDRF